MHIACVLTTCRFAFNIERACQSTWRCVSCLSGPMSMYRSGDLETILFPWNLQTFGGKHTTFGDDRHLTNQLLAHNLHTRYTHRTWCESESPTQFVRWVAQQTRWSKSFFREAIWFPESFAYQSPWMLLETTVQTIYPFILMATVFVMLFDTSDENRWRPLIWLVTMFAIALFKCIVALFIARDPWLLLFSIYGFIYFFGLLPSKVWALLTMKSTGWGTSARSSAERKRGQSLLQRSFHVGHLVVWYAGVFVGVGFFIFQVFNNALFFLIAVIAVVATIFLYWDKSWFEGLGKKAKTVVTFGKSKKSDVESSTPSSANDSTQSEKPQITEARKSSIKSNDGLMLYNSRRGSAESSTSSTSTKDSYGRKGSKARYSGEGMMPATRPRYSGEDMMPVNGPFGDEMAIGIQAPPQVVTFV